MLQSGAIIPFVDEEGAARRRNQKNSSQTSNGVKAAAFVRFMYSFEDGYILLITPYRSDVYVCHKLQWMLKVTSFIQIMINSPSLCFIAICRILLLSIYLKPNIKMQYFVFLCVINFLIFFNFWLLGSYAHFQFVLNGAWYLRGIETCPMNGSHFYRFVLFCFVLFISGIEVHKI